MASLYTSLPNIQVEILDCIEDAEVIEEYKGYAMEQRYNYEGQHPWNSCKKGEGQFRIELTAYKESIQQELDEE
jgi:hypothetical protein